VFNAKVLNLSTHLYSNGDPVLVERHIGTNSYLAIARFFVLIKYNYPMQLFDGKKEAENLDKLIQLHLSRYSYDRELAIVQIGDDQSSDKFIDIKVKLCERFGIKTHVHKINDKTLSDGEIFKVVEDIFSNEGVLGGIVQLPLPRKSLYKVLDLIPVDKDVDVISTEGKKRFYAGDFNTLPPVVRALNKFIEVGNTNLNNLNVTVIGDGELVGKPLAYYLSKQKANVSVLSNYDGKCKIDCQLLILSAGVPNLVKGENIKAGCSVVDYGSSIVDGKCVGDLDMSSNIEHLDFISKSPGGMGPLVVSYLIMNFLGI
jgi:methylenetetrahydrofolate dehydrogenase (NADP+)/methenyltetrahydrofolate cyclohydrolase